MQTILAVAVGPDIPNLQIVNHEYDRSIVRPYIEGLILGKKGILGKDYIINYRQGDVQNLGALFGGPKDVIFCMSIPVVHAAQRDQRDQTTKTPIVGNVSDPHEESFDRADYICGVSANRFQTADACLQHFLDAVPSLTDLWAYHNPDNRSSNHSRDKAKPIADARHKVWHDVLVRHPADAKHRMHEIPTRNTSTAPTSGIFAIPVDTNFASARTIIETQNSSNEPAWFGSPDWVVDGAFGGYGASQLICGKYMAERVDFALSNKVPLPNPRWTTIAASDFEWLVNAQTAKKLQIDISKIAPCHIWPRIPTRQPVMIFR
jgi:ABC-type uncharacterized transport system substrate-binding protein